MGESKSVEVTDSLESLIEARHGDLAGLWPYRCTLPDGTKRFVLASSPKSAAEKLLQAKRCTQGEVTEAALAAMKKDRESLFREEDEADDAA